MFNPYIIILSLFLLAGLITTLWGLAIIVKARRTQGWPCVDGVIEESRITSGDNDLLPFISFSYTVGQASYRQNLAFSPDITPTQEFTASYLQKYPAGTHVKVYYHPGDPEKATLEPGLGRGEWLVFAFGLGMFVFAMAFLFLGV